MTGVEWLPGIDRQLHATRGGPVLCGTARSDEVAWPEAPRCSTCVHLTRPVAPPQPPAPVEDLYAPLLPRIANRPVPQIVVEPRPGEHPSIYRARVATAQREAELAAARPYPDAEKVRQRMVDAGLLNEGER